jgi:transcriptional regulator with XRE-family HTH domain
MTRKQFTRTFLTEWRERAGATQEAMAEAMGITTGHLSNVERGKRQYTQELLEAAVAYLQHWFPALSVADILTLNPSDPGGTSLVDAARHVPAAQRDAAVRMLRALSDAPAANDETAVPPPRRRRT